MSDRLLAGLVRHVAREGVSSEAGRLTVGPAPDAVVEHSMDRDRWERLVGAVDRARLIGLLQAALERGSIAVTPEQRDQVADLHMRRCADLLALERALLSAIDLLDNSGIDVVVLKGTAHARLLYPDPSWRMFGDNDLLVKGEQFSDAVGILLGAGYRRSVPEARPGFDARFGKGAALHRPDRDELDLHRTLLFGTFGFRIDRDELFASSVPFELGGRTLRALGPDTRLLHLCYHAALGDPVPTLRSVRDLLQALSSGTHDADRVLALAREWEAEAVLSRAFDLCDKVLGVTVDGPLAHGVRGHRLSRRERRAIASYVGANRGFARKVVSSLSYIDGVPSKAAFLRAAVAPSGHLRGSVGSRRTIDWLVRGATSMYRRRG